MRVEPPFKPESGGGRTRVLHRNLLVPCHALELDASNSALGTRLRKIAAEGSILSVSANGLQSSGEKEDDSVSVDLVDEIPCEVAVSESVSLLFSRPLNNARVTHTKEKVKRNKLFKLKFK